MARNKFLRVISRLWRHDSVWPRWGIRSLKRLFYQSSLKWRNHGVHRK